jgi:hypothetical protein
VVHFLQSFFVVCIVFTLEIYSSLLDHSYGCLIGFFTLLFNHNFSKSVCFCIYVIDTGHSVIF